MSRSAIRRLARLRDWCATGEAQRIREGAGLTMAEVARACDVTPSAISHWEKGIRRPGDELALRYERVLAELVDEVANREAADRV
jgi:transcriptional regulator with XRE-family HTH domain